MANHSLPYGISAEQRYLIARLRWLCAELIAGNQFDNRTLRGWVQPGSERTRPAQRGGRAVRAPSSVRPSLMATLAKGVLIELALSLVAVGLIVVLASLAIQPS